jgi:Flp pilus assembly protein TadD
MTELDFTLAHKLNAVLGWLELGSVREARAELDSIPAEYSKRPEFLEIRWLLQAREKAWDEALHTAEQLLEVSPDNVVSWLHRSYAMRRASSGGVEKAAVALRPAVEKFPKEATIPYNLACYACQMGKLDEARAWLSEARKRGGKRKVHMMALNDSDLEPLWPEIKKS